MQLLYRRFDQQHGPIGWEALVELASQGGLYPTDLVWAEGWPNWQEARQVPGLFPAAPPAAPAASPAASPAAAPWGNAAASGASPYSPYAAPANQKSIGDDPMMRVLLPVGRSPWAIIAGYMGLFSFLVLPAPLALVTGLLAIRDIRKNPHHHGLGRAIFGLVMGVLGTVFLAFIFLR